MRRQRLDIARLLRCLCMAVLLFAALPTMAQTNIEEAELDSLDDETIERNKAKNGKNSAAKNGDFNAMNYILDKRWRAWGEDFTKRWDDHLFVEVGGGLEQMVPPAKDYHFNAITLAHFAVGKQFDRYHTARLTFNGGWGYQQETDRVFTKMGVKLDHLFSLSSYFDGYNPSRLLEWNTVVGVGAQQSKMQGKKGTAMEAHAGLQLRFFTGPQGYFAVEPYIGVGTDKMDLSEKQNWRKTDVFYGAKLSYIYYIHNNLSPQSRARFIREKSEDNTSFGDTLLLSWQQPWFVELSTGLTLLNGTDLGMTETMGHGFTFSIGKWLSPVIGLKLSGTQQVTTWKKEAIPASTLPYHPAYERTMHNTYSGMRLEALFNPFGFDANYKWDRPWGCYLSFGGEMGWITKFQEPVRLSCRSEAYTAALHGWVRLADGLQAFIEPRFNHYEYKIPYSNVDWNKRYSDNGFSINVGMTVTTTKKMFRTYQPSAEELGAEQGRIVVGLGGGMSMKQTKINYTGKGGMHYTGTLFAEYHLNHVHGVRASFEYAALSHGGYDKFDDLNMGYPDLDYLREERVGLWDYSYSLGLISLDYMANLTNLFAGYRPDRKFECSLFFGPSVQMTLTEKAELNSEELLGNNHQAVLKDEKKSKMGIGINAGMKLQYNLTPHIGLHLTPNFYLLGKETAPGIDLLKVRFLETVSIGAQYKF
ncbi:MAG: hypothetical protein MR005_05835 [Prevotella sp.]|nr:hypothetical protein [Prevotella sp.]